MASSIKQQVKAVHDFRQKTQAAAGKYLIGYEHLVDNILTAFLADGHVILIGLPGLGKTLLVKTLSSLWGLNFSRVQFTPDLLPSDITGTEILQEKVRNKRTERVFEFQKGPIFANLVLADEINRTPPKTQSALLQAMEEKEVTVGRRTLALPAPFMVMATQNPIEMEGTYPLPEAQLDRFLMSLHFSYPTVEEEKQIALLNLQGVDFSKIKSLTSSKAIMSYRSLVDKVVLPDSILDNMIKTIRNTRPGESSVADRFGEYGAGPRATQFLVRASRARALLMGETVVTEQIFADVFKNVLRHRIILNYVALAEKVSVDDYLDECLG